MINLPVSSSPVSLTTREGEARLTRAMQDNMLSLFLMRTEMIFLVFFFIHTSLLFILTSSLYMTLYFFVSLFVLSIKTIVQTSFFFIHSVLISFLKVTSVFCIILFLSIKIIFLSLFLFIHSVLSSSLYITLFYFPYLLQHSFFFQSFSSN